MVYKPNEKPKLKTAKSKATAKQYDISLDELIKEYPNKINFLHRDIIDLARKKYNKSNRQIPYRKFKPKNNKNNQNNINIDIKKVEEPKTKPKKTIPIIPIKEKEIKPKKIKDVYIPYSQPFKVKIDQDKRGLEPEKLVRLPLTKKNLKEEKKPVFKFEEAEKIPAPVNLLPDGEQKKINFIVKPKGEIEPYGTIKSAMFRASLGVTIEDEETGEILKEKTHDLPVEVKNLGVEVKQDKLSSKETQEQIKKVSADLTEEEIKKIKNDAKKFTEIKKRILNKKGSKEDYKFLMEQLNIGILPANDKEFAFNAIQQNKGALEVMRDTGNILIDEVKKPITKQTLDYALPRLPYAVAPSLFVWFRPYINSQLAYYQNELDHNFLNLNYQQQGGIRRAIRTLQLFYYIGVGTASYSMYNLLDEETRTEINVIAWRVYKMSGGAVGVDMIKKFYNQINKISKKYSDGVFNPELKYENPYPLKADEDKQDDGIIDAIKDFENKQTRGEELTLKNKDSIDPEKVKANDEANNIIGALTINDIKLDDINIFTEKYYRKIDPETKQRYDNAFNIWARENYRHLTLLREGAKVQDNHPVADDETIKAQAEEIKNLQDKLRQAQENRDNIPTAERAHLEQGERLEDIPTATHLSKKNYEDMINERFKSETFYTSGGGPAQTEPSLAYAEGETMPTYSFSDFPQYDEFGRKTNAQKRYEAGQKERAERQARGEPDPLGRFGFTSGRAGTTRAGTAPPQQGTGPPPQQGARAPPIIPDPTLTQTQTQREVNIAYRGTVKGVAPPSGLTSQIISGIDETDDISEFPFLQPAINLWFHQYGKDWSRYLRDYKRNYTDRDLLSIGLKYGIKEINKKLYLKGIDILNKNWYNLIGVLPFNPNKYDVPTLKELYIQLWAIVTRYKVTPRQEVINSLLYSDLTKQKQSEYSRSQNMGLVIDTKNLNQDQILNILRNQAPQAGGAPPQAGGAGRVLRTGAPPQTGAPTPIAPQNQGFGKFDKNIRTDLGSIETATGRTIEDLAKNKVKINYLYTPDAYYSGEHISKLPVILPEVEPNKMLRFPPIIRNIKYFPVSRKRNYNFIFEKNEKL